MSAKALILANQRQIREETQMKVVGQRGENHLLLLGLKIPDQVLVTHHAVLGHFERVTQARFVEISFVLFCFVLFGLRSVLPGVVVENG